MKSTVKKILCILMSTAMLTGLTSFTNIVSFAAQENTEYAVIDTSNPYSYKIPGAKEAAQKNAKAPSRSAKSSFPAQYDSRNYGFVTPVRNQGQTGTCWAHSTMAAIESYELANGISDSTVNYSESHLVWFALNPKDESGQSNANDGTNLGADAYEYGGNRMDSAITLANTEGINNDADYPLYPYDDEQYPFTESDRYTHSSGRGIKDAEFLETADEIKQAIISNGGVTTSFCYAQQFEKSVYESGHRYYSYYCDTAYQSNHAVTAVGWDDNYPASRFKTDPGSDGAWLIKDSWGTGSKDNGYFWISYADASLDEFTSFSTLSLEENYKNYSYTGITPVQLLSCTKYSNIYTSSGYELISTVGILNYTPEANYTVKIYKNPGTTNPESGTLAGTATRYLKNTGYYTFEFNDIPLNPSEKFAVVVSASSSNTFWVALESSGAGAYTAHEGESFRHNGARWVSTISSGYGNTYIFVNTKCNHQTVTETSESTCSVHGHVSSVCTQCEKVITDTELPLAPHSYTFNSYITGDEILRYRTCENCGASELLSRSAVTKTVPIGNFIQMLFDLIFAKIYSLFGQSY